MTQYAATTTLSVKAAKPDQIKATLEAGTNQNVEMMLQLWRAFEARSEELQSSRVAPAPVPVPPKAIVQSPAVVPSSRPLIKLVFGRFQSEISVSNTF
jgi:2,4-dienoyl-CoA reductase-like NADH-dependent reductase (Old Yellow Enzyme family)